jgi:hypothetical protein
MRTAGIGASQRLHIVAAILDAVSADQAPSKDQT